jgi:hypothetical protein
MGDQGEAADFDHMVADLQRQINQDRYVMSPMNQFAHTLIVCDNMRMRQAAKNQARCDVESVFHN